MESSREKKAVSQEQKRMYKDLQRRPYTHLPLRHPYINEARGSHPVLLDIVVDHSKRSPNTLAEVEKDFAPLAHCRVLRYRVVVAI